MSSRIAGHLRSNVVGYVAVFIALSGTAYAVDGPLAGQDQVGSADIINNEVQSADIRDANLTTADIRAGAVTSGKVADDTLTGVDIAHDALGPGEIQDITRGVSLPLATFVNRDDDTTLDFTPSNGTSPDFSLPANTSSFFIEWDADTDGGGADVADTDDITSGLIVPPDFVGGSEQQISIAVRASKTGHSGVDEHLRCAYHTDGSSTFGLPGAITASASRTTYLFEVPETATAPGDAVQVICRVDDGAFNGSTANDAVRLHGVEFRYTATE